MTPPQIKDTLNRVCGHLPKETLAMLYDQTAALVNEGHSIDELTLYYEGNKPRIGLADSSSPRVATSATLLESPKRKPGRPRKIVEPAPEMVEEAEEVATGDTADVPY